jgi:hypothetical protein
MPPISSRSNPARWGSRHTRAVRLSVSYVYHIAHAAGGGGGGTAAGVQISLLADGNDMATATAATL